MHTCIELDTAIEEIPQLLAGEDATLSSGIGTNLTRQPDEKRPFPRAVLIGGGLSDHEYSQIREAVKAKLGREAPDDFHWVKVTLDNYPKDLPPGEPPIELIKEVARKALDNVFKK